MARKPKDPEVLHDRHERFCQEYIKDLNGTKAAERAGYAESGAHVEASRLLNNPKVQSRVKELMDARARRVGVNSDEVLREISRLGYSDIRGLYNEGGTIKHPKDWPDELARAVAGIEVEELFEGHGADRKWIGYTKKIKLWPKNHALELMGKHKKLFTEKVEHSGTVTLEALVSGAAQIEEK